MLRVEGGLRAVMQCDAHAEKTVNKTGKKKKKSRQTETQGWDGLGWGRDWGQ